MKSIIPEPDGKVVCLPDVEVEELLRNLKGAKIKRVVIKGNENRELNLDYLELANRMGLSSYPVWMFTFSPTNYKKKRVKNPAILKKLYTYNAHFKTVMSDVLKHAGKRELFLVGGTVRDVMLSVVPKELDLLLNGDAISFAERLRRRLNAKVLYLYEKYGTVSLLVNSIRVDFARPRKDFYPKPGAEPQITWTDPETDLLRRDFTINAILYDVRRKTIIDVCNGVEHLRTRLLTPITPVSFYEDPTRCLRGLRLAVKLSCSLSEDFLVQMEGVKKLNLFDSISRERMFSEIKLMLNEEKAPDIIKEAIKLGLFEKLFYPLKYPSVSTYDLMEKAVSYYGEMERPWYLKILLWLKEHASHARKSFVERYRIPPKLGRSMVDIENMGSLPEHTPEERIFLTLLSR